MINPGQSFEEEPSIDKANENLAPEGSLAEVNKKFGTLLVDDQVGSAFHRDYKGHGDRVLITTKAEGSQGPKTGKTHLDDKEGTAFIDFALTPETAQRLLEALGKSVDEYNQYHKVKQFEEAQFGSN